MLDDNKEGRVTNCIIIDVRIHAAFQIPAIAWVQTDIEDYFIKIETDKTILRNPDYIYTPCTYEELYNQLKFKDVELIINDVDSTADNYVKIQYKGAYLPLRAILEGIGVKVDWDGEKEEVTMSHMDEVYVLKLKVKDLSDNYSPQIYEGDRNITIGVYSLFGGYQIIDGRIVFDSATMNGLTRLFRHHVIVDDENLAVYVRKGYSELDMGPF